MVRSLYSGVAGLINHQTRMDVIGNNIANVNTYGFKSYRVTFRDVLGQNTRTATGGGASTAGNNPSEVGYGVSVGSIDRDMTKSSFQSTNNTLDLAIDGDGFFVCSTFGAGPGGGAPSITQSAASVTVTRMGAFNIDSLGRLVTTDSRFVMGMSNSMQGLRSTGPNSSGELEDQQLTDTNGDMQVTASDYTWNNVINVNKLIQDAYNIHTDDNGYLYTYKIATGTDPVVYSDPTADQFEQMFKVDADNDGFYDIDADRDGIITPAEEQARVTTLGYTGFQRVACNLTGEMITIDGTTGINVTMPGATTPTAIGSYNAFYNNVSYLTKLMEGIPSATLTATVADGGYGLTLPAGVTDATTIQQAEDILRAYTTAANDRGLKLGELTYKDLNSFTVGKGGEIAATYNNELKSIARIDLGVVDNPGGLDQAGNTSFTESGASGPINIKAPNTDGAGALQTQRLEMSNVNLATEFSDMIVTQRGYQANARIITTSDSMLEELVNLKR
ncbi:MAG: flagellar hook-basal body complex protein [Ruminococcus sp.]|jgi:flagellar hook protein FlgE|nr:flagellar hook-basal body complex protein [Ruminococcus sp.]